MPFDARTLAALIASDATTLWFYRTDDTRAAVLAPGYFAAAADRLAPGHVILAQTADSLSLLPVRQAAAVGNGLVLDVVGGPLRRSAAAALSVPVAAGRRRHRAGPARGRPAARHHRRPSPSPSAPAAGGGVRCGLSPAQRRQPGRPGAGGRPRSAAGRAVASLIGPAPGSGYRIRAQDAADADARSTSASFTSVAPAQLATEGGEGMQGEGGEILLA